MRIVDVAMICALQKEAEALLKHVQFREKICLGDYTCHVGLINRNDDCSPRILRVAVLELGAMGNLVSLHACSEVIRQLQPHFVMLVGICGGISGSVDDYQLGDIVVSDRVFYYEPAKTKPAEQENRGLDYASFRRGDEYEESALLRLALETQSLPKSSIRRIEKPWPGDEPERHLPLVKGGDICSGEKVIASSEHAEKLRGHFPSVVSIEMEAAGIAFSCERAGIPFLVVKAVSDFANADKNDSYNEYACASAAAFAVTFLLECRGISLPERYPPLSVAADLLRLSTGGPVAVVLPGYPNPRHKNSPVANYPFNMYETAYDDVYCAFRLLPCLQETAGRERVQYFREPELTEDLTAFDNTILVGSSIANSFTRATLDQKGAFFYFGTEDEGHAILSRDERFRFSTESQIVAQDRGKVTYVKDYGLLTVFSEAPGTTVILAGCRAFGQVLLGDFLYNSMYLEDLFRLVHRSDFQCIIEAQVVGRGYSFAGITALVSRESLDSEWKDTEIPRHLRCR